MAGPERALPYRDVFWANTQKHTISAYHDRWLLLGATIGKDDELVIVRHDLSGLMDSVQLGATVASQTGLHINIKDQRDVIALKLSKHEDNNAEFITLYNVADDGTETATGGAADGGAWADASLRELKSDMKDLTEHQINKVLDSLKIYRFKYTNGRDVVYVSPEAEEFHQLTGWGDGRTLSPGTTAGIALRCVQYVWKFVNSLDKRLKAIETRLADDAPSV